MTDAFTRLYDNITERKSKPEDFHPYTGGNGRIDRAVDLILNEDFPRRGTLLDVGGATGNLGFALREHFSTRIVIDIADGCRPAAESKGNKFYCANIDSDHNFLNVYDGQVDLICVLDFIEHILDPGQFARGCYRLLKPGGKVLINTPNIQYWRHLESLVCRGIFPHTSGDQEVYHGGHVAFFNMWDMINIFGKSNAGFDEMQMHTRGLTADPPPPIWMTLLTQHIKPEEASRFLSYPDLIFSCRKS